MKGILEHIQNSKESYHILNSNFREKYDEIEDCIKKAAVISIDSEFSGLTFSSKYKNSLFDSGEERYDILKKNIENFIVIQIGLTVFNFDREENQYTARMYNFFIFPRAVASIDNRFACQSSSLQFLAKNSFDFNKFVYEGIPYLNEKQEEILVKELSQGNLFHQVERNIPLEDERVVQKLVSEISVWSLSSKVNDTTVLEHELLVGNQLLVFLIHKEIRERFDYLWTSIPPSSPYKISVIKVEADDRNKLRNENSGVLERNVVDFFLGFSKLFKLLISLKKPIVGHNILLDLMILYNQFYEPLPNNYHTFKKKVNCLFPKLFDTKYISYELKKVLRREDMWVSNAVLDLYKYFSEGRGREATLYRPDVKLMSQNVENLNPGILLHEAGWDSYICGYCFIQMGHYFACATYGRDSYRRPLSSTEHINGVLKFMNKINIVRASIPYIDFAGDDPPSNRPQRLLIKTKNKCNIDIIEVTEMLAKYCSVDIKPFDQQRALVAVSSYPGARQILKDFLKNEKYKVSVYHPLRDSKTVEVMLWSGLLLSSGLCFGALLRNLAAR